MKLRHTLLALLAALAALAMGTPPTRLPPIGTWALFYGANAPREALAAPDLLVLEPGHPWDVKALRRPGQTILAYLSLGEVHAGRPYYQTLASAPGALLGPNPDWEGAWRIDPRSSAWRTLLLGQLAPAIRKAGYDGFFLDTVDVGPFLEREKGIAGAGAAMAELIADLRALEPEMRLVSNGGLELLPAIAKAIDAVATESVFTAYDFKRKAYAPRPAADAQARAGRLAEVRRTTGLPVLVIEYVDPRDAAARAVTARQVRDAGFVPFVTDIGLETLF